MGVETTRVEYRLLLMDPVGGADADPMVWGTHISTHRLEDRAIEQARRLAQRTGKRVVIDRHTYINGEKDETQYVDEVSP